MVQISSLIFFVIWSVQALMQVLAWVYWLQVKEYRFDRFQSFLSTLEGRKKLNLGFIAIKIFLILLSLQFTFFATVLAITLLISAAKGSYEVYQRKLRRPVFTLRAKRITATVAIALFGMFFVYVLTENLLLAFLLGEILLPVLPFTGVLWTKPLVEKARINDIKLAMRKLSEVNPVVIGITGSYGKTTTKEFLAHILSSKFITEKTKKNENTDFGIARKIIQDFNLKTEVFVVEMGAYKKGEIKKLCGIVSPTYGIITGIEPQHIDLFGSFENIKNAKFELIEALPKEGTALFNVSNRDVDDMSKRAGKIDTLNVQTYALRSDLTSSTVFDATMQSYIKDVNEKGVNFLVYDGKKEREMFAPVHGAHFVENLTGAILLARDLGVAWKDIREALRSIKTPEGTMDVKKLGYGSILIDDSYNTTPKGFEAAVNYLKFFKGQKKAVITPGIIELGRKSASIHKRIGMHLSKYVDLVIVTNAEPALLIKQGMKNNIEKLTCVEDVTQLIERIEGLIENGYVILIEGRLPQKVNNYLENRVNHV